jgi:hypothetical protein
MILVPANEESEAGVLPSKEAIEEMGKFNAELAKAGVLIAGDGLHATSKGAKVRFTGGKPTVTDGPFTEAKELIAGYWLFQVKSKDEAVEWVKRAPFPPGTEIEIRQVIDMSDFPADSAPPVAPEVEAALRSGSAQ